MLNGELLYTKILEVNLFAFAYRDFSPLNGAYSYILARSPVEWREISMKQSVGSRLFHRDASPLNGA